MQCGRNRMHTKCAGTGSKISRQILPVAVHADQLSLSAVSRPVSIFLQRTIFLQETVIAVNIDTTDAHAVGNRIVIRLRVGRTGAGRQVAIACSIDEHPAHKRSTTLMGFRDNALNAVTFRHGIHHHRI